MEKKEPVNLITATSGLATDKAEAIERFRAQVEYAEWLSKIMWQQAEKASDAAKVADEKKAEALERYESCRYACEDECMKNYTYGLFLEAESESTSAHDYARGMQDACKKLQGIIAAAQRVLARKPQ